MDTAVIGALYSLLKALPDTAVSDALAAAVRAEAAATAAETHNMGVAVVGKGLVFTSIGGDD